MVPLFVMAGMGVLFMWAWHGRRVDEHPMCRWCGFDLTGKEEDSPRCPECWHGVSRAYGVRTSGVVYGHREKHAGWAAFAAITFAATFVLAFGAILVRAAGSNLYGQYPVSMVITSVTQGEEQDRAAAAFELAQRMKSGGLKKGDLDTLWDKLLLMQAEKVEPWRAAYGEMILAGRQNAMIDEARWKRYIDELTRQAIVDNSNASRDAIFELKNRALSTCMSRGELDPIVDYVLRLQGDTSMPWWSGWGDLVESGRTVGMVDDVRWAHYVQQGIQTETTVRPQLNRGDPLHLTIQTQLRAGSSQQVPMAWVGTVVEVSDARNLGVIVNLQPPDARRQLELLPSKPIELDIPFPKLKVNQYQDGPIDVYVHQHFELVLLPRFNKTVDLVEDRESKGKTQIWTPGKKQP